MSDILTEGEPMPRCDRCGYETNAFTGSYFNTEVICLRCADLERQHPDFAAAKARELEEVKKGNYNYEGVGLPPDLVPQHEA